MFARSPRRTRIAAVGALISTSTAVLAVVLAAAIGGHGPNDLHRFEQLSGVDLPDSYGSLPWLLTWTRGDGTTFVTMAADLDASDQTRRLGLAAYRYSRVGLSALTRVVALGSTALIPVALLVVNVAAAAGSGWLFASRITRPRDWLVFGMMVSSLCLGVVGGTSGVLASLLVLIGLAGTRRWSTVAALALGTVRPEYAILFFLRSEGRTRAVLATGVSALSVRLVGAWLGLENGLTTELFELPLRGYVVASADQSVFARSFTAVVALLAITLLVLGLKRRPISLGHIASGLFILTLGPAVLVHPQTVIRVLAPFPILGLEAGWPDPDQAGESR